MNVYILYEVGEYVFYGFFSSEEKAWEYAEAYIEKYNRRRIKWYVEKYKIDPSVI